MLRFINPQSHEGKPEDEKIIQSQQQFYSIDDVEPVDTPDGGFAPDYNSKPHQYVTDNAKSDTFSRQHGTKELDQFTWDVSTLSKKLFDIQEEVNEILLFKLYVLKLIKYKN